MPAPLVLVGGASRRMGTDKALLDVDGVPAALRVARVVAEVCGVATPEVLLVGGPAAWASELGLGHLDDDRPGEGPLAAIETALRRLGRDCLVVACDLLGVDVAAVDAVRGAGEAPGCDVAVAVDPDGRRQPLLARWNVGAAPVVTAAVTAGERAPRRVLDALAVVDVAVGGVAVSNVNSPDELSAFLAVRFGPRGVTDLTVDGDSRSCT